MADLSIEINDNDIDLFVKDMESLNIFLTDNQINEFISYYCLLVEWNSFMNLTAITDFSEVAKKHFVDSVSLVKAFNDLSEKPYRLIDVGTGAGFPGIPLKIIFPNLKITLLDSLNKRIQFLNHVCEKLNLKDVENFHGRAEEFARPDKLRESFDFCVSRAVSNLSTLSEYCIPFVKKNGYFIPYKSSKAFEEYKAAKKAINLLGGKLENQIEFNLPDSDIYRNILLIKKVKNTPLKFPRKSGLPLKEPIA